MTATARTNSERAFTRESVLAMLQEAARADATDLHFKVPCTPRMRVGGILLPLGDLVLTARDTLDVAMSLASIAGIELVMRDEVEFAFGVPRVGRFRANVYRQRGSHAIVLHRVRVQPPSLAEIGAPPDTADVLGRSGLTLVAGRNVIDTVHALVRAYNTTFIGHLVLIESPIGYLHRDERAVISHREVGQDTPDFPTAIRRASRAAADQIVVASVADAATAEAILEAAEAGIPVIAAVRCVDRQEASHWFLRNYSGEHRVDATARLSSVLHGVVGLVEPHTQAKQ